MTRLPLVSGKELCALLERAGWIRVRQRGSHVFMESAAGTGIVVPVHGGEDLGRGLLRAILREADISIEEYLRLRDP